MALNEAQQRRMAELEAQFIEGQKRTRAEFARKEAEAKANGEPDGYFEIFAGWDEAHPAPAIPRGMLPPKKRARKPK